MFIQPVSSQIEIREMVRDTIRKWNDVYIFIYMLHFGDFEDNKGMHLSTLNILRLDFNISV